MSSKRRILRIARHRDPPVPLFGSERTGTQGKTTHALFFGLAALHFRGAHSRDNRC